jgi:hypothetical protein
MRRLRGWVGLLSVVMVALWMGTALAEGPITLKYKFTPNQKLTYVLSLQGKMSMASEPAMPMPMDMDLSGNVRIIQQTSKVASDGVADVVLSCPSLVMDINMTGQAVAVKWQNQKMTLTLNGEVQPVEGVDFNTLPFLGKPITMRMTPQGKVVDFKMPDMGPLSQMMGNMDFSQLMKTNQNELPDHPINVGDSWTTDVNIPMGGAQPLTVHTVYSLDGIEGEGDQQVARIKMHATCAMGGMKVTPPAGATTPQTAMTIESLSEDVQGTSWFSLASGQNTKASLALTMQEVMSMTSPQGPQKMTMNMNAKVGVTQK